MDIFIGEDEQQWLDEVLSGAPSVAPWHGQEPKQGNGFPEAGCFPAEELAFEGNGALMGSLGAAGSGDLDIWTDLTVASARPAQLDLPELDLDAIVSLDPKQESLRSADAPAAAARANSSADEGAVSGSGYPLPPHSPPEACTAESSGSDTSATHEKGQVVAGRHPSPAYQPKHQPQQQPIQLQVSPSPSASNSTGFGASDSAVYETSSQSGGSSAQSSEIQIKEGSQQQQQQQQQQQRQQEGQQEQGDRCRQEVVPPGMDPKAYARQMRNRESAAQSRVRKKKYMEEMEQKMQHLEAANAQLNGMVQQLSAENAALKCQLANAYSGQKPPGGYAVPLSYPVAYPHPYMAPASAPIPAPKLPIPAPKRKGSPDAGSKGSKKTKSVPKAAAAASAVLLSVVCCLALVSGPWTTLGGPQPMPLSASSYGSSSELARSGRVLAAIGMGGDATAAAALLPSDLEDGTLSSSRSSSGGGFRERRREDLAALPSGVEETDKGKGGGLGEEKNEDGRQNDRRLTLPQLGPIIEDYQTQPSRRSRRAIDHKGGLLEAEAGALVPEGIAVYQDAAPAPEASSTVARWSEYSPDVTVLQSAAADLNVIESLWDVLDAKLDARECHCISHQLKAEVKRVWLSITIDTCRQLVEPMASRAPIVIQQQSGHIDRA